MDKFRESLKEHTQVYGIVTGRTTSADPAITEAPKVGGKSQERFRYDYPSLYDDRTADPRSAFQRLRDYKRWPVEVPAGGEALEHDANVRMTFRGVGLSDNALSDPNAGVQVEPNGSLVFAGAIGSMVFSSGTVIVQISDLEKVLAAGWKPSPEPRTEVEIERKLYKVYKPFA